MRLSDPYNVSEFRARSGWILILFGALLSILVLRLWYLQIWKGDEYRAFSDKNRFKSERLSAPRGKILDRNGILIADSRPRFDITVTRGYAEDLQKELSLLKKIFKWEDDEFEKKKELVSKTHRYNARTVARAISMEQLAVLESHSLDLPSVDAEVSAVRDYLYHDMFFHVIGYTGEINDNLLRKVMDLYPERNYRLGDSIGIMGMESLYEDYLRGKDGRNFVVVDVKGRRVYQDEWNLLPPGKREEPKAGLTLQTTLDLRLQETAFHALGDQVGAVVAIQPKTGEVLAHISKPALNPNIFTEVIGFEDFQKMTSALDNPFLDRVVGEHYPPGSTLKIMMAIAGLESGFLNPNSRVDSPASFRFGRRTWGSPKNERVGYLNVMEAIESSSDVFFYKLGLAMGLDSIFSWGSKLGFGRRTFIGNEKFSGKTDKLYRFNSEQPGFIPYPEWVRAKGNTTVEAEAINSGIGQGAYSVTMLQLARLMSFLGNGGVMFQPQLVKKVLNEKGELVAEFEARKENQIGLQPETKKAVMEGLRLVVEGNHGTARGSRLKDIQYGGKTGTAQVVALDVTKYDVEGRKNRKFKDHALFVALAPLENPEIAIAIIVENGGWGSTAAAPIAKAMIQTYFTKQAAEGEIGGSRKF